MQVGTHRAEMVDRFGLRDRVELAALVELQRDVGHRLEAAAESTLRLANTFGDRPHLAPTFGDEGDDSIGFAKFDRPQDDGVIPIELHVTLPKRRSRRWNSRTASNKSVRRKSGHRTSVNTSSA